MPIRMTLYMFRTAFPSIIRSWRLYIWLLEWHSTCFGRSFRPSSGVQDCTYSCPLASSQQYLFDIWLLEWHSTCFGRSFRPSSGVQDFTYSCQTDTAVCLLASRQQYCWPLASSQQYLFDMCLLLYIQFFTPDDWRKDRPKHVEYHSKIK